LHSTRRVFLIRSIRASAAAATLTVLGGPFSGLTAQAQAPEIPIRDFSDDGLPSGPFTSAPRALPPGTTHVGIHWRGQGRAEASVHARTSPDGRSWSEWVELSIDDDPFGDADETFAALIDARGASHVQYRVVLPGGRRLERVTVTTIEADVEATASIFANLALAVETSASGPSWSFSTLDDRSRGVYTRQDWGCDESLGLKADGTRIWPAMLVPTKKLVVHHTATGNRYTDGAAEMRAIYAYHARTKGWGDIGYNALIDRFGNVYEGRRGREGSSRELLSSGVVAGHVFGHNYGTSGVALIGDFTKRKISLSNTNDNNMMKALEDLIVFECGRARVLADGASDFLKSDDTWHLTMPTISGHKDSVATACPGTSLYSQLGSLRQTAKNRLASYATPLVTFTSSPAKEASAPASLSFSWTGASSYHYRLEGWRKIPANPDDIEYWTGTSWSSTEPAGWNTSEPTGWTAGSGPAVFSGLARGHYSLHVRGYNSSGRLSAVQPNFTVLVR
jgi:hypothetical protein